MANDLQFTFSADSAPFQAGANRVAGIMKTMEAETVARSAAMQTKMAEHHARTATAISTGYKTQLTAASAGIQDFVVVASQGGANSIGRAFSAASNNVSQFASAFGPAGVAIGGVVAVAASLAPIIMSWIPPVQTAEEAIRKLIKAFDDQTDAMTRSFRVMDRAQDLRQQFEEMGRPKGNAQEEFLGKLQRGIADARKDVSRLNGELDRTAAAGKESLKQGIIARTRNADEGAHIDRDLDMMRRAVRERELKKLDAMDPLKMKDEQVREMFKDAPEFAKKIIDDRRQRDEVNADRIMGPERLLPEAKAAARKANMDEGQAAIRKRQEDAARANAEATRRITDEVARQELARKQKVAMEQAKLTARADQVTAQFKTPMEKVMADIKEFGDLRSRGLITPETFDRGRDKIIGDFQKSSADASMDMTSKNTAAVEFGSSGALSSIYQAMRTGQNTIADKQLREQQELVKLANEQVKLLEKAADQPKVELIAKGLW